jgi:hypothetical protein
MGKLFFTNSLNHSFIPVDIWHLKFEIFPTLSNNQVKIYNFDNVLTTVLFICDTKQN